MKILLTGATGYIGKRLLIQLLGSGHEVICSVRDKKRFDRSLYLNYENQLSVIEHDYNDASTLSAIDKDIEIAFYLIHSMSANADFSKAEKISAKNFAETVEKTDCKQVIYLTGIVNDSQLSKHLQSRKDVEDELKSESYALTVLRAGIIIGSGSASFEIIRDLVEKLPVMVAPKWLKTLCQPIAIRNVIEFLIGVMGKTFTYNKHFDIAGPDVLSYKQMLLIFAKERKLKRTIISVPVLSPKISSYWLYFITSTSYVLAKNLVDSMKVNVVAEENDLAEKLNIKLLSYDESLKLSFDKIEQNDVLSTWYDSFGNYRYSKNVWNFLEVPSMGVFKDKKCREIKDEEKTLDKIFGIGGKNGWYHANYLWSLRGSIDKLFGGVGLKRGRKNSKQINAGDSVDFWRVLYASRDEKRLLLFAEMKLPGEAWLDFKIIDGKLIQEATFRPVGIFGRLYWYTVLPFHGYIFSGMIKKLTENDL
ncbi:SDR family oxidoreductase [Chryseobacterium wangxinyae]|uniref:SDR family oxidoreductase n=1 Tax=Chryseobacterium sp. CY350 TaxID=2997336 RepID=UPI0022704B3E|nr:SDR family oxidoreductase [Chryseobacterium sp. CY350]MCY0976717.1 SDR family oxidoreductase [Chryseobacterium sp. CY350]WBZ96718.1 SDR family oxidoreductase [Chryseobacterium sp. CY350]